MTTGEAAALLGLSPATVRRQVENGAMKARKVGRDWHITPAEVERYRRESLGKRRAR
jgi:excisionase family DNA binding protein